MNSGRRAVPNELFVRIQLGGLVSLARRSGIYSAQVVEILGARARAYRKPAVLYNMSHTHLSTSTPFKSFNI